MLQHLQQNTMIETIIYYSNIIVSQEDHLFISVFMTYWYSVCYILSTNILVNVHIILVCVTFHNLFWKNKPSENIIEIWSNPHYFFIRKDMNNVHPVLLSYYTTFLK